MLPSRPQLHRFLTPSANPAQSVSSPTCHLLLRNVVLGQGMRTHPSCRLSPEGDGVRFHCIRPPALQPRLSMSTHAHVLVKHLASGTTSQTGTSQHFLVRSLLVVVDTVGLSVFPGTLLSQARCDTSPTFLLPSCAPPFSPVTVFPGSSFYCTVQSLCCLPWTASSISVASSYHPSQVILNQHPLSRFVSWVPDCHIPLPRGHVHAGDPQAPNGLTFLLLSPSAKATTMPLGTCPLVPHLTCTPKSVTRSCPPCLLDVWGLLLPTVSVLPLQLGPQHLDLGDASASSLRSPPLVVAR